MYDVSGQRLLRRAPNGLSTLYVAGHEITANAGGTVTNAVRPYTFDGQLVATRTAGGVEYLVTDAAGSVELAVRPGQSMPVATRAYEPYGQVRSQTGDTATDRLQDRVHRLVCRSPADPPRAGREHLLIPFRAGTVAAVGFQPPQPFAFAGTSGFH